MGLHTNDTGLRTTVKQIGQCFKKNFFTHFTYSPESVLTIDDTLRAIFKPFKMDLHLSKETKGKQHW